MNVILLGFKAAGKSTVGRALARLSGRAFLDADEVTEALYQKRCGKALSCREIYARHGAKAMRDLETEALRGLADMRDSVLATGGGAVLAPENIALLQALGLCVFLDTPHAVIRERLAPHADSPLFRDTGLDELLRQRRPLYLAAAHKRLAVPAGADAETIARSVIALIPVSPE